MTDRRLGFIGCFGFYVLWLLLSYGMVFVMGHGFLADLQIIGYRVPLSGLFIEGLERNHSELRWPLSKLKRVRFEWRNQLAAQEMDDMDRGTSAVAPGRLRLLSAADWENPGRQKSTQASGGSGSHSGSGSGLTSAFLKNMGSTQLRVWNTWKTSRQPLLPAPDPYGFPVLPLASLATMQKTFPSLRFLGPRRESFAAISEVETMSDGSAILGVGADPAEWARHTNSDGLVMSFPMVWRHAQMTKLVQRKQTGVWAFLTLAIVGLIVTGWLAVKQLLDAELAGWLRTTGKFLGVTLGIGAVVFLPNFRTCYRPSIRSDAEDLDQGTVERIKRDCYSYLDVLEDEQRISNDEKQLLRTLLSQR